MVFQKWASIHIYVIKRKDTINNFNNLTLKEFGTIQYSPNCCLKSTVRKKSKKGFEMPLL